jgi:hypothetical protein
VTILAIVGSRSLRDREPIIRDLIEQVLDEFAPAALVSGGAATAAKQIVVSPF